LINSAIQYSFDCLCLLKDLLGGGGGFSMVLCLMDVNVCQVGGEVVMVLDRLPKKIQIDDYTCSDAWSSNTTSTTSRNFKIRLFAESGNG
jgi:hypothetical protein